MRHLMATYAALTRSLYPIPRKTSTMGRAALVSLCRYGCPCSFHVRGRYNEFPHFENPSPTWLKAKRTMLGVKLSGSIPILQPCLLFHPSFSELGLLRSHLFLPCECSVMLRSLPASCVVACAVSNKIVRNLPFCLSASSSLQGNRQKEYFTRFSRTIHMGHIPASFCM